MADSTTALTSIVLLGLGLCQGPWNQVQAGDIPKPSIWVNPGPIVTNGSSVTIRCQGSLQASAYVLYKEGNSGPLDTRMAQDSSNTASFLIGATTSHAGLYRCAYDTTGNILSERSANSTTGDTLSERSDPLLLVVTGVGDAPSLSAQPGPVVASGENVSLSCSSNVTSGPFHLLKEGEADPIRHMEAEPKMDAGRWRVIFPLGPVRPSHGGTYRCYRSSSSRNVWSQPSDPVELVVSGEWYLTVLIGVSVALILLLSLLLFLFLRFQRQSKGRTSDAVAEDTQPERDRQPDSQAKDPQAAAPDHTQEVTYAQLKPLTLSQQSSAPPPSPSEESPEEHSMYATLAKH